MPRKNKKIGYEKIVSKVRVNKFSFGYIWLKLIYFLRGNNGK